jgi:hypothetical protein
MSIDRIDEFDEMNGLSGLRFEPIGELNGREVIVQDQNSSFAWGWSDRYPKEGFSLKNRQIEPMMAKIGVSHTDKNGEKTEVELTIDTRNNPKPVPAPPPNPPSQQGKPKH